MLLHDELAGGAVEAVGAEAFGVACHAHRHLDGVGHHLLRADQTACCIVYLQQVGASLLVTARDVDLLGGGIGIGRSQCLRLALGLVDGRPAGHGVGRRREAYQRVVVGLELIAAGVEPRRDDIAPAVGAAAPTPVEVQILVDGVVAVAHEGMACVGAGAALVVAGVEDGALGKNLFLAGIHPHGILIVGSTRGVVPIGGVAVEKHERALILEVVLECHRHVAVGVGAAARGVVAHAGGNAAVVVE